MITIKQIVKKWGLLSVLALFCACGNASDSFEDEGNVVLESLSFTPPVEFDAVQKNAIPNGGLNMERKIIRTGSVLFETHDVAKTRQMILEAIKEYNGYLSDERIGGEYGFRIGGHPLDKNYSMTIRVPMENFDPLLDRITSHAVRLDEKSITSRDVTEEFVDVQARLKTKKELEDRYRELLRRANTVSDMLQIEREMGALRSEIESVEGRLKYLTHQTEYSALDVSFYEKATPAQTPGLMNRLGDAFSAGWRYLLSFFVGLVSLWPFILIGAGIIFAVGRFRKNRKKKA